MRRKQRQPRQANPVPRSTADVHLSAEHVALLHELHVYHEELLVQNEALVDAQLQLEETRDLFVDLYEFAPNGYLTLAADGIILRINLTAAALLGRSREELRGAPLLPLVHAADRTGFVDFLHQCRRASPREATETDVRLLTTEAPRDVHLIARRHEASGGRASEFLTALVDVTERKTLERLRTAHAKEHAALVSRLFTAQDEERRRLSRELHDDLGQQVTAVRLHLELLIGKTSDPDVCRDLENIRALFDRLDRRLHLLSSELRPSALDLGLVVALRAFVHEWSTTFNIEADFAAPGLAQLRLRQEVESHLYRVVQEALNNVAKHADAKHVSVLLERRQDGLVLVVEDDGRGFDVEAARQQERALGLLGMRERTRLVGGTLEIDSTPRGTSIFLVVPLSSVEVEVPE
jgi:two-component system sensor histidine kinase UhpB